MSGDPLCDEQGEWEGGLEKSFPQELMDAPPSSPAERLPGLRPCPPAASHSPGQSSRRRVLSPRQAHPLAPVV